MIFSSPAYAMTTQEQYVSTLTQLISLLEQQVLILQQQLASLKTVVQTPIMDNPILVTTPTGGEDTPVIQAPVVDPNQLTFINQPVAGPLKHTLGGVDYIYIGSDWHSWTTSRPIANQKEICTLNGVELQPSAALEFGQTYTCTLTVTTEPHWNGATENTAVSNPYTFTVPDKGL